MDELVSSGSLEDGASIPIGVALARLRRKRGLTGKALGALVNMSQARISKIETGSTAPSPADVKRLATALEAAPDVIRQLTERAEVAQNHMTDWRVGQNGLVAAQQDIARFEATARVSRIFQSSMLSGLLQTAEYARAVFTSVHRQRAELGERALGTVPEAVSARIRRQEVLADASKQFVFVMLETVLEHLICSPIEMPAQIQRIRDVSRQENVVVGIVPVTTQLLAPPLHQFYMFDEKLVLVDVYNTFLTTRGRIDIATYRNTFEILREQAIIDIEPILDKHLRFYLKLAAQEAG